MTEPTIRYKLTDQDGKTRGDTVWGPGEVHETDGSGPLCGPGWLHVYSDPLLAVLLNQIHADYQAPRLCEVEVSGRSKLDWGLKEGWTRVAFRSWLPLPEVTTEQRITFGILCAKEVYKDTAWNRWADAWLDGTDRSARAAYAAAHAAADYAAYAARAAAHAAHAAASLDLVAIAHRAVSLDTERETTDAAS